MNGAIKCQQISGGDGYATMGDGTQTYMFSFGPLSGLADIANGLPGTEFPNVFNTVVSGATLRAGRSCHDRPGELYLQRRRRPGLDADAAITARRSASTDTSIRARSWTSA